MPARAVEGRPFAFGLRKPVGNRPEHERVEAHAHMGRGDFNVFGLVRFDLAAGFP